ncbi:MAG: alcohol dehydrogenase catalytic domain-containing protein [Actinomycetota bacterium]|nr:alcohol dehydrogenase catalytic domain-containing protein [Actinomycetota bacterium]
MRQLTYIGADELRWEEVRDAQLTSDTACVVRPMAVASCDLDGLILAGTSAFPPPFAIGHEGVGEIVDLGDAVNDFGVGDRVSIPFQISCGTCPACLSGRTSNCQSVPRASTYGFGPQVKEWGGFLSDLVCVPFADHMLVPVPMRVPSVMAASASDNIVDGWRAVGPFLQRNPGAEVLVVGGFGPGSIGLYAVATAIAEGASRVVSLDADARRNGIAAALGAHVVAAEPWPRRLGPFPITVDACGTPEALSLAIRSTAPDGNCTSTAIYFDNRGELPLLEMYEKVITFKTGRTHARPHIPRVLSLLESGSLAADAVTTRTVDWADAPAALVERDWVKLVIERPALISN